MYIQIQWGFRYPDARSDPDALVYRLFYLGTDLLSVILSQFTFRIRTVCFTKKICLNINFALFNWTVKSNDTPLNTIERLRMSVESHTFFTC